VTENSDPSSKKLEVGIVKFIMTPSKRRRKVSESVEKVRRD